MTKLPMVKIKISRVANQCTDLHARKFINNQTNTTFYVIFKKDCVVASVQLVKPTELGKPTKGSNQ